MKKVKLVVEIMVIMECLIQEPNMVIRDLFKKINDSIMYYHLHLIIFHVSHYFLEYIEI